MNFEVKPVLPYHVSTSGSWTTALFDYDTVKLVILVFPGINDPGSDNIHMYSKYVDVAFITSYFTSQGIEACSALHIVMQ